MPPARRGLGVDPLDALTQPTDAPSVGSVGKRAPKRRIEPVKLDGEVLDEVRSAVVWLQHNGEPYATLKAVLERAARNEVQRLADERNGGELFPKTGPLPRGGRMYQ